MVAVEKTEKVATEKRFANAAKEVWSYIKALETRTRPVDNHSQSLENNMRLTEEWKNPVGDGQESKNSRISQSQTSRRT